MENETRGGDTRPLDHGHEPYSTRLSYVLAEKPELHVCVFRNGLNCVTFLKKQLIDCAFVSITPCFTPRWSTGTMDTSRLAVKLTCYIHNYTCVLVEVNHSLTSCNFHSGYAVSFRANCDIIYTCDVISGGLWPKKCP